MPSAMARASPSTMAVFGRGCSWSAGTGSGSPGSVPPPGRSPGPAVRRQPSGSSPGRTGPAGGYRCCAPVPGVGRSGWGVPRPQKGCQSLGELVQIRPLLRHKAAGGALTILKQTQQQVLRADSVLPQAAGGGRCLLDGLAAVGGQPLVGGPGGHAGAHQLGDGGAQGRLSTPLL